MVGYNSKNNISINGKYLCPSCSLILRDPVQLTECGHRLCQSCVDPQQNIIKCPKCQTETFRDGIFIDQAFKKEIDLLQIDCGSCGWKGTLSNYQEHHDRDDSNPKCEYCNQQFTSIDQLNQHQNSECENFIEECLLKEYGCSEKVNRKQLREHYQTQQHQDAVIKVIHKMTQQSINTQMEIDHLHTTTELNGHSVIRQIQEMAKVLNILSGGIEKLNENEKRIKNESNQIQDQNQQLEESLSELKLSVEESKSFLDATEHNQDILNQELSTLKEKIDDMRNVSYDGTFVWKITNFKEKMNDALSERQTSIDSLPFYSSPTGYKMRARLYLNGDGNARGTHLSLFFVLMRSQNDSILKFPFNHKVTFCLYDQTGNQRHIIDSFRPDIKSNSFQRPRSDMNIASGIPKFFPLSMIQQEGNPYVQDDTMFIKVMVDFGDLPKTLLPFIMSLNPGLPMHIQQMMIKQEIDRRSEQQVPGASTTVDSQ